MFPPPWLTLILDSKFYEDCDEHEGTLCNFFCIDCSDVFCESCKQEHDDEGHKVLQVSFFFWLMAVTSLFLDMMKKMLMTWPKIDSIIWLACTKAKMFQKIVLLELFQDIPNLAELPFVRYAL